MSQLLTNYYEAASVIVVSVSVTAFSLALVLRLYKHYGSLDMDEILRMMREEEGE